MANCENSVIPVTWIDPELPVETRRRIVAVLATFNVPELTAGVAVRRVSGGASNENFEICSTDGARYVLRLTAGSRLAARLGLDRWRGLEAHRAAYAAGAAPQLVAVVLPDGHSLVDFVDFEVVDDTRIRRPEVLNRCIGALRTVHLAGSVSGRFLPSHEVDRYRHCAESEGLPLPKDAAALAAMSHRVDGLMATLHIPETLCHNDVQLSNFLCDGESVSVLDWEYAGNGNPFFDLAMVAANASFDDDETATMLDCYFGSVREVDLARVRLQQFQAAIREAMWSVIAKPVLQQQTGWDYDEWADTYFDKARITADQIVTDNLFVRAAEHPGDRQFYRERLGR